MAGARRLGWSRPRFCGRAGVALGVADEWSQFRTRLPVADEVMFERWRSRLPERLRHDEDYDLRGFYRKNPGWSLDSPEAHMTDEFKLPNHPTFSNESRYYGPATQQYGGHWAGDVYVPNDKRYKGIADERPGSDPDAPQPRADVGDMLSAMMLAARLR